MHNVNPEGHGLSHQAALSDHKKRVHGPREYICGICSADFATETYLRSHVRIHDEKRFVCLECKHGFSNPSDLKNHMRIHNDEKPFECEVSKLLLLLLLFIAFIVSPEDLEFDLRFPLVCKLIRSTVLGKNICTVP
uniref:Zinc finger protein 112 n=1 Tax=Schistosoma haematobium TaxID=6185 RepID=A0A095CGQ8_SCHHA